jgi:para-nitrobenzyl esterase
LLVGTNGEEFLLFLGLAPEMMEESATPAGGPSVVAMAANALFGNAEGSGGTQALDVYRANRTGAGDLKLLSALETDRAFRIPAIRLAEAQARNNSNVYMYFMTWRSSAFGGQIGAGHGVDLPFVFDNLDDETAQLLTGEAAPIELAEVMHGSWVSFVTEGEPRHAKLPEWQQYDLSQRATMRFDAECRMVNDPEGKERELWEAVL